MTDPAVQLTCPMCGMQYDENEGRSCRSGCPMKSGCGLLSCPRCGYEITPSTRVTRWLSRLIRPAERS